MSIVRVAKRPRYTTIARATINDERLSFRARGVLAWLLDKPDDWSADSTTMARAGKEGRDAIRAALKELETFGYLTRTKVSAEGGRWVTESVIYETPLEVSEEATEDGFPGVGQPGVGFPGVGDPGAKDQELITTTDKEIEEPPTPLDEPSGISVAKTSSDVMFETFYALYPRKVKPGDARKAWAQVTRAGADPVEIVAAARAMRDWPHLRPKEFLPYPASWLRAESWKEDLADAFPASEADNTQTDKNRTELVRAVDRINSPDHVPFAERMRRAAQASHPAAAALSAPPALRALPGGAGPSIPAEAREAP